MRIRQLGLFVAAAALTLPAFAASGPMKAGKWQMTSETHMEGMDMKMPPMTFEHCVTPEEAAKSSTQPPKGKNESCKITDYKLEGNSATWKFACEKPAMSGEGKITYAADSFEEQMNMEMKNPRSGEAMKVSQKMIGKRIGDCSGDEKK